MNQRRPTLAPDMNLDRFDLDALSRGFGLAVVIAVPAGLIGSSLDRDSTAVLPLFLLVFLGLAAGAATAAARQDRGLPLAHGIVAALAALAVAQVLGIVRRIFAGDKISVGGIVSNVLLALIAGTFGGLVGAWRSNR
jgi:hypothetical protein